MQPIENDSGANSVLLCIVPAAGKGTRLGPITKLRAKPSVAIGFDPASGHIIRMIDVPLEAIRQAGGHALVTTHYASETLDFVKSYRHVTVERDDGYITPLDSAVRNLSLIESSPVPAIGIVPADYEMDAHTLIAMQAAMTGQGADAVILGTRHLQGHLHIRPLDKRGLVVPEGTYAVDHVADLGVHLFRKGWFTARLRQCMERRGSIDVWHDFYRIDEPVGKILVYVPEVDGGWLDMGYPFWLRETIYRLNASQIDGHGNICFPGAKLAPGSTDTIALPSSVGLTKFSNVIIPEDTEAKSLDDVLPMQDISDVERAHGLARKTILE